jgi:hypothetical protein
MFLRTRDFHYDEVEQIVFVRCPQPVTLEADAEIDAFFDESLEYWREHVNARVYYVVEITNLTINMRKIDTYTRNIKRMLATSAITIVRYGGGSLQRAAGRLASMKLHVPSNIYATRQEAVEVVRGLRQGKIQLEQAV